MKWIVLILLVLPLLVFFLPQPDLKPVLTAAWIVATGSVLIALVGGGSLLGQAHLADRRRNRGQGGTD